MNDDTLLLKPLADITESLRKAIAPFTEPVLKEIGEYIAGRIRFINFKRSIKVLEEAKRLLDQKGIKPKAVNLKILVPILEGAGLEESDDLIEMWSGLLASAASEVEVLPSFPRILSELSPIEAKILDYVYTHRKQIQYEATPGVGKEELEHAAGLPVEQYAVRILNLRRLGLIDQVTSDGMLWQRGMGDWGAGGHVGLTALGNAIVSACKGPSKTMDV